MEEPVWFIVVALLLHMVMRFGCGAHMLRGHG